MEQKTIYISGAIGSIEREQAYINFNNAEELLHAKGYIVLNPMKIEKPNPAAWKDCMLVDIKYLFMADEIYMLNNWRVSTGARIELSIAIELGLKITFEDSIPFNVNHIPTISDKERQQFVLS